jgi:TonB family protein
MAAIPLQVSLRRRHARYELQSPIEVTVLRSGIPQNLPGRLVDVGLGGIRVVLSGDLYIGESVGVDFPLADTHETVQARARVRYQDRIRCGLEFSTLSPAKLELVRQWTEEGHRVMVSDADRAKPTTPLAEPQFLKAAHPRTGWSKRQGMRPATKFLLAFAVAGALAVGGWAFRHFFVTTHASALAAPVSTSTVEDTAGKSSESLPLRVTVPSSVMQSLITYRTVPVYPEAAQQNDIEGTVLLDTIVGKDGRVLEVSPSSGPPELADAATAAVRNWRFSPFTLNGDAVEVETTIEVEFRLKDR